jgi:hypothetical protein
VFLLLTLIAGMMPSENKALSPKKPPTKPNASKKLSTKQSKKQKQTG